MSPWGAQKRTPGKSLEQFLSREREVIEMAGVYFILSFFYFVSASRIATRLCFN